MRRVLLLRSTLGMLLAHDLRLAWRDFRSNFRLLDDRALAVLVALLLVVMHAAAWRTGSQLAEIGAADAAARARVVVDLTPGMAFILLLMFAQVLSGITRTLYGRGDLELILSSPCSPRIVLAVRLLAVGLGAAASAAIFVVPVMDVALVHGAWRSLALVPVLAGASFVTAALGFAVVMALFGLLGPRRTRLAAQILATFVGGGFMIWLQISRDLPDHLFLARVAEFLPGVPALVIEGWRLPVRAATGEGVSLLVWMAAGPVLYTLSILIFAPAFARGIAAAASVVDAPRPRPAGRARDRRFDTRLAPSLRAKEWRLIRRDPWLLSQLLLQILYMTPMLVMLMRGAGAQAGFAIALAPMIVVVAYQVSASMTWLGLSAEDAPELLLTAPVAAKALQWGKLVAVGQLTAMLAVPPLVWLAMLSPRAAAGTACLAALGVAMAMVLSRWHTKPAKRTGFAARHRESKLLALMEMVMSMLLGVTAALMVSGSLWSMVPLGLAGLVLLINRPRPPSPKALLWN